MRGQRAEKFVVLALRLLAISVRRRRHPLRRRARARRSTSCPTSANCSERRPRPPTQEYLWLSLGFAYMVVITGICLIAQSDVVRYRPLLLLLAAGKAASSLTSLVFSPGPGPGLRLPAGSPRRRLADPGGALALGPRRAGRPSDRTRRPTRAGASGRRTQGP